jgi:hypothetical protein
VPWHGKFRGPDFNPLAFELRHLGDVLSAALATDQVAVHLGKKRSATAWQQVLEVCRLCGVATHKDGWPTRHLDKGAQIANNGTWPSKSMERIT